MLKDKFIFLYGGSNDEDIYEDFWVFNTEMDIWFEIKNVENRPSKRIGCTINRFEDNLYMFGG